MLRIWRVFERPFTSLAGSPWVMAVCLGCGQQVATQDQVARDDHVGHDHAEGVAADHDEDSENLVATAGHDHTGWWCPEHGVPEEECALCDYSLVDDFKANGDWCDEHQRPKSHCFTCTPENQEKYAARYRAKYGEEPPPLTE